MKPLTGAAKRCLASPLGQGPWGAGQRAGWQRGAAEVLGCRTGLSVCPADRPSGHLLEATNNKHKKYTVSRKIYTVSVLCVVKSFNLSVTDCNIR